MKRKYGNGASWKRLLQKTYEVRECEQGMLGILHVIKVKEPSYKQYDHSEICIVNDGYTWVQYFIKGKKFVITAMLDEQKNIVQYYIDIAKEFEIDENGLPYFDDLYLDVVLFPDGKIYLLDEGELEAAYAEETISRDEYNEAWDIARWVMERIEKEEFPWISILKREIETLK
ncbi:DUF402 domain-containing protein [Bacillus cereus group sp. BfR-BA-01360]|uniref:DUF402 domain-containing protein n=1 Tax=Bacillus cereus group sp. BfR-BA-01360 TaxID=2920321 RepID=UPI001F5AB6AB|nr:DUF402 domain-containing protein [Bacillus cereus group sp. BfR-BA-01360]